MMLITEKKRGILLVNLGTPDSYAPSDVYRYLKEFLNDKRVIDLSWFGRLFVQALVVPLRYRKSAKLYRRLWTEKGSPLLVHGREVAEKLQQALGSSFEVVLAMRYQNPSIKKGLEELKSKKADEIIILPLFPQYASATTGSVHQKVMECIKDWLVIPKLTFIDHFCDHPLLIDAFMQRASQYEISAYDHILFSFHGLPERHIRKADRTGQCLTKDCCFGRCASTAAKPSSSNLFCYKAQCFKTAKALAAKLGLAEQNYTICFQSRLGREPWLQPYTSNVLHSCAAKGNKKLLVFCPSFVCDCLETTCEISFEYAEEFQKLGGKELQLVEGLNSHPSWIEALRVLILDSSSV